MFGWKMINLSVACSGLRNCTILVLTLMFVLLLACHPYGLTKIFQRRDVVRALHAEDKPESWVECSGRVSDELHEYLSPSAITLLPSVLEKIPVLLFAGDQDYICNYMGIENMIKSMTWNGEKGLGVGVFSCP